MKAKNPFPGMNPFFEQRWRDAHTMLIAYMRDALQERLPEDLFAGAEEELIAVAADAGAARFRPDVAVTQPWKDPERGGTATAQRIRAPKASDSVRVYVEDEVERWLEIHDRAGRLVTVIELLSPSNKMDETARERYRIKRRAFISSGVHVVEIDLLRRGSVFPDPVRELMAGRGAAYAVCVFFAGETRELEVYPIGFRDPLPVVSIPLRQTDPDVPLDLQPLVDRCHERGRYHLLRYDAELDPPLSDSDRAWVREVLSVGS